MAQKETFLGLVAGDGIIGDWIERTVPDVPDLPTPGTLEESTLTIAKYCDNCNKIMQQWEGVPLFEVYLRGGQRSSTNQAILLSALEGRPGADGIGAGISWEDYLRIMGFPGGLPTAEHFKGIGGKWNADDTSNIYAALGTWGADIKSWIEGIGAQIEAAEEAYIAGEEYNIAFDAGDLPVIVLPDPIDVDSPSPLWQIVKWVSLVFGQAWLPIAIEIAKYLLRRAANGEQISPLLKLLRKALLVREDDEEQGMPDYTSLLLLNADKPLEIYTAEGVRDVFLDTRVREDDE